MRDGELVQRFRNGDRDACSALYRTHHAAVFRIARYLTGGREQAGEVTQDGFVWLLHHPAAFDTERGDLPALLGGVARQFLHRRRRDEQRRLPLNGTAVIPSELPETIADGDTGSWRHSSTASTASELPETIADGDAADLWIKFRRTTSSALPATAA